MYQHKPNKNQSLQKGFPLQLSQYNRLTAEKKHLVKQLLYLFTFYSAKSSRYSYNDLSQKYFIELLRDVWIDAGRPIKDAQTWNDLHLLYHSKGKQNNLDFSQFLDLLPAIGIHFDSQLRSQESIKALIHHMLNIYSLKVHKELERHVIDFEDRINEETRDFIFKLVPDFTKVYKIYFSHQENNKFPHKNYQQQSFESYVTLLKEFEVFPKLVSTRDLFYIFNEVLQTPPNTLLRQSQYTKLVLEDRGEVFRLSKFIQSLIAISRISIGKLKQIDNIEEWQDRQKDILKVLLEYMETVKSIQKKKSHYNKERFSFIVYEEYPQEILMKTITVHEKNIKQSSDKLDFYKLLDRIDF